MQISRFSYALPIVILMSLMASLPARANIDPFAGQFFTPQESARASSALTGAVARVANELLQAAINWPISTEHDSVQASSEVVHFISVSRQ
ncbi:hypothetical protein [Granulosicoccus antarcticus]|uniref:Uncharacterized protein n=1 Tax=Granulosicoccus antarcticus IMCC3135 TaxID=1192854 RepID=A0A2Z2NN55_9GAMM|nr:hypothetical protein [Granulosicoccus antarcticus]ASJ71158.1 hypothetical protein IMCC3135_05225 [Granulosicoccus antarcticus IMCC3135]